MYVPKKYNNTFILKYFESYFLILQDNLVDFYRLQEIQHFEVCVFMSG